MVALEAGNGEEEEEEKEAAMDGSGADERALVDPITLSMMEKSAPAMASEKRTVPKKIAVRNKTKYRLLMYSSKC